MQWSKHACEQESKELAHALQGCVHGHAFWCPSLNFQTKGKGGSGVEKSRKCNFEIGHATVMNIFVLHTLALAAAHLHADIHFKMILESTQLLYTTLHTLGTASSTGLKAYKPTHHHHPCALWVGACAAHVQWVLELGLALCARFREQRGKPHACEEHLRAMQTCSGFDALPANIGATEWLATLAGKPVAVVTSCASKVCTLNPPRGCLFGVACVPEQYLVRVGESIDLVASYRAYYVEKPLVLEFDGAAELPNPLNKVCS
jgi:hypothetical protein